jgi:hypothetical protein
MGDEKISRWHDRHTTEEGLSVGCCNCTYDGAKLIAGLRAAAEKARELAKQTQASLKAHHGTATLGRDGEWRDLALESCSAAIAALDAELGPKEGA